MAGGILGWSDSQWAVTEVVESPSLKVLKKCVDVALMGMS